MTEGSDFLLLSHGQPESQMKPGLVYTAAFQGDCLSVYIISFNDVREGGHAQTLVRDMLWVESQIHRGAVQGVTFTFLMVCGAECPQLCPGLSDLPW